MVPDVDVLPDGSAVDVVVVVVVFVVEVSVKISSDFVYILSILVVLTTCTGGRAVSPITLVPTVPPVMVSES